MRLNKPVRIALAAVALVVLAALAFLWIAPRTAYARNLVADWMTGATGLPATVDSFSVGFLRGLSVQIGGLKIAQPAGFGDKPLIEVGTTRISAPFGSLFGDPVAHAITIDGAVLRPAVLKDGSNNWSALIDHLTAGPDAEGVAGWAVGRLDVKKSALEYDDASTGTRFRLTAITIAAADISPASDFPLELQVAGVSGTNTFLFSCNGRGLADTGAGRFAATGLNVRGWAGGDPLPLAGIELLGQVKAISFESASGLAALNGGSFNLAGIPGEFAGSLEIDEPGKKTLITFRTETFAPRAPAVAFGVPLPRTADEKAFGMFQISVEGRMRDGVLHLDPIEGRLDETAFNGLLVPSKRLIRVAADRIEVDRYLAPEEKGRRQKKATLEAAVAELAELDIDAEIRIGEARVAGARLRDTVIRVERNGMSEP